ncbi:hypothetical protein A9Q99_02290 [Gammaproteobacteria bacterium 45_16_T64]|nr:hypothetical protein A9Q99_02290 [Gammaproteobacteria bacterium 45_16_T64]
MEFIELYDKAVSESHLTFDPSEIDVRQANFSCHQILDMLEHNEINLATDFQRSSDLWSASRMSKFIESMFLDLPIPPFYFNEIAKNEAWEIIDGLQRLSTLKSFCTDNEKSNKLILTDMDFFPELNGLGFESIPRHLIRNFHSSQLQLHIVSPDTPFEVKHRIFERINTTNLPLKAQEVRHALYQGYTIEVLKRAVDKIISPRGIHIKDERMECQQMVLRLFAFSCFGYTRYPQGSDLKKFLDNSIRTFSKLNKKKLDSIYRELEKNLDFCQEVLGEYFFVNAKNERKILNKGILDSFVYAASKLNKDDRDRCRKNKVLVLELFQNIFDDDRFIKSISSATSRIDNVKYRMDKAESVLRMKND